MFETDGKLNSYTHNVHLQVRGGPEIKDTNGFEELSKEFHSDAPKITIPSESDVAKDVTNGDENVHERYFPFSYVSVKMEDLDDHQDKVCDESVLENSQKEYVDNYDTTEHSCVEGIINIEQVSGIQSNQNIMFHRPVSTLHSEDYPVERTGDHKIQLESICETLEVDLKEEKYDYTEQPLLQQDGECLKLGAEVMHEKDENKDAASPYRGSIPHQMENRNGNLDFNKTLGSACMKNEPSGLLKELIKNSEDRRSFNDLQHVACCSSMTKNNHHRSLHSRHKESLLLYRSRFIGKKASAGLEQGHHEKIYPCEICNRIFNQKSNLNVHRRTHTGEKPFQCDFCKSYFSVKGALESHIRIHTAERPFSCKICLTSFTRSDGLSRHMRMHTNERPYVCVICTKAYKFNQSLKEHMYTHTGEKPHKCEICTKSFSSMNSIKRHYKFIHGR